MKTFPLASRWLSLSRTHAHPPSPSPRSLLLSGERQSHRTVHLQESSLRRVLLQSPVLAGPGLQRRGAAGEVRGRKDEALSSASSTRETPGFLGPGAPAPAVRRQVPADGLSETSRRVHLAATPAQLQPRNPASKCCGRSPTQPHRCPSRHRGLERREIGLRPPVPSTLAPSPPRRCEFQHQTRASRCCLCHFAEGGREREGAEEGTKETNPDHQRKKK